jgi:diguanylate cyclase (GGDEF)-like protein
MMADIDGLKKINDTYGHHEGSDAIIELSKILRKIFRDSDVIARLGGDEFTVLIINAAKQVQEMIAERLQKSLDEHNLQSEKPYKLSASAGLTAISFDSRDSIEEIIKQADMKMYEHKRDRKLVRT